VAPEGVEQQRFDFELVHPGPRPRHRELVRFARHPSGAAHRVELVGGLAQAHLVQKRPRIGDLGWNRRAGALSGTHPIQRGEKPVVEGPILAQAVDDATPILEQSRQLVVELTDEGRLVRAEALLGAVHSGTRTIPYFAGRIARAHEEGHLALDGVEHQDALGLVEAGEVVEIRILPVVVFDVVVADEHLRRRQNRHGRWTLRRHGIEQTRPAKLVRTHQGV
jgi:hypothetical protein